MDQKNKRNFRLVPFALLDEAAKESNRNSTRELLRTLMGYGYAIEAPDERSQSTLKETFISIFRLLTLEHRYVPYTDFASVRFFVRNYSELVKRVRTLHWRAINASELFESSQLMLLQKENGTTSLSSRQTVRCVLVGLCQLLTPTSRLESIARKVFSLFRCNES